MCKLCRKREGVNVISIKSENTQFSICDLCLEISKSYYLAFCHNCKSVSWILESSVDVGSKKGEQFTVLNVRSCIACEQEHFYHA